MRRFRRKDTTGHASPRRGFLATHRGIVGRVRFWSEAAWAALPEERRPRTHVHLPGVGWIAFTPAPEWNN